MKPDQYQLSILERCAKLKGGLPTYRLDTRKYIMLSQLRDAGLAEVKVVGKVGFWHPTEKGRKLIGTGK